MIEVPFELFRNKENALLYDGFMNDDEEDVIVLNKEDFVTSEIDDAIDVAIILREPDVVEYLNKIKNNRDPENIDRLKKEIITYITTFVRIRS
ncbi:MAG: hypothetical protein IJJ06_04680 [Mogibacterium sp.]|nr:hypothetical protein [Mogibacterium sp.]